MESDGPKMKSETTVYRRIWWAMLLTLPVLVLTLSFFISTAGLSPVGQYVFWTIWVISALLGVYSLCFIKKLPTLMCIAGMFQSVLFGFNFLSRLLFAG